MALVPTFPCRLTVEIACRRSIDLQELPPHKAFRLRDRLEEKDELGNTLETAVVWGIVWDHQFELCALPDMLGAGKKGGSGHQIVAVEWVRSVELTSELVKYFRVIHYIYDGKISVSIDGEGTPGLTVKNMKEEVTHVYSRKGRRTEEL
jgi:hypothetical protein